MKTQKSLAILAALLVLLGIQLSLAVSKSSALDNPHNLDNTVSCGSCHDSAQSGNATWWTDQGNGVCFKCHNGTDNPLMTVHSDAASTTLAQCTQCHNPHSQQQNRTWKTESYLYTGISDTAVGSVTISTLKQTGAGWGSVTSNGDLTGYLLLPDVRYQTFIYRIASNTTDTITVDTTGGGINLTYCKPGATFAIVRGKLIKETVNGSAVKFFRETGSNSFADGTPVVGGKDTVIDGICQVCHTTTKFFNTQGDLDFGGTQSHPNVIATSQKCAGCHNHKEGFKPLCKDCHGSPPVDALTLITKSKDNVAVTSNSPGPGAHNAHVTTGGFACDTCHTGGMLSGATGSGADNQINIGFKINGSAVVGNYDVPSGRAVYPVVGEAPTTVTNGATLQCSNLYCHDPGSAGNKSPSWLGTISDGGECDTCHGGNKTATNANGGTGPMSTGKHPAHTANTDANLATFACGRCHAGTVTTGNDRLVTGTKHVNMTKDVQYDSLNSGGTSNSCSNLYCHSNGKGVYNNTLTIAGNWTTGAAAMDCKGCHGTGGSTGAPDYTTGGGGAASANSHGVAAHVSSSADCVKCHTNTTTTGTTITGALHLNQAIDVTMSTSYAIDGVSTGHYASAVGSKTCSTVTCHGTLSPKWGTDLSTIDTCTKCHGQQTVAPAPLTAAAPGAGGTGVDTGGNSTGSKVGAHRSHLEATHTYSLGINCSECHTVPNTFGDPGHISSNGTTSVLLAGTLARTGSGSTPNYSAGQCSNVYCHDSSRFKNGWSNVTGTVPQPVWSTPILAGGGVPADCGKCHGFPPDTSSGKHPNNAACHTCHQHVNSTDNGFLAANTPVTGGIEKHVNGLVEGGGCDTCHGNPPTTATYSPSSPSTGLIGSALNSGDTGATSPLSPGAHDRHFNALTGLHMTCDACHAGYTSMGDYNLKMGFKVDNTTYPGFIGSANTGTFTGWTASAGTKNLKSSYTWSTVFSGTTITTTTSYASANTCAVYCHGAGTTGKLALTGGTVSAPTWTNTATAACGACHGGNAFNSASASPPTTGAHNKHANSANLGLACNKCHASTPTDGSHVNGSVAWQFDTSDPKIGAVATYNSLTSGSTGTLAPSQAYASCSNINCHSIVQQNNGGAISGADYKTINWSAAGPLACTACHGYPNASGAHMKHAGSTTGTYSFLCSDCHNGQVPPASTVHANGAINTAITSSWGGAAVYNGDTVPRNGFTGSNCSNVYCHSDGSGGTLNAGDPRPVSANTSITWNSTDTCSSCHGSVGGDGSGRPNYSSGGANKTNSHMLAKHSSLSCDKCHYGTTQDGSTIPDASKPNHVNRKYDVVAQGTVPYTFATYTYATDGGTCGTSYCHGSASPKWGATSTLTCSSCHTSMGAGGTAGYTGKHQMHASTYNFSCEMCHSQGNGTVHVNGEVVAGTQSAQVTFRNGVASWTTDSYNASTSTYRYRSLLTNPYDSELAVSPTPTYTSAGTVQTDGGLKWRDSGTCNNMWCHSNAKPAGGAISYATPTWGATLNCGSCHSKAGDVSPTWSAPHNKHITSYSANANVSTCVACHYGTATSNSAVITGSTSSHVNAKKDVIYNPGWVASNGTYTTGQGCQNTYCHSNGTNIAAAPYSAGTQSWQGATNCYSCHGISPNGMPDYTSGGANKTNSHRAHVMTQAYVCVDCHSNTVNSSNAITSFTNHVNKSYDVNGATFSATSYTYYTNGGTCSTKCHGSSSNPKWGSNSAGSDSCTKCHGSVTTGAQASVLTTVTGSTYPWSPTAYLAAPSTTPNTTGLFTDLSNTQVGAHQEHLTTTKYRLPIACGECHQVPSQPVSAGHMNGLPATVSFQPAVSSYLSNTHEGAATPNSTYNPATATCSTSYCHDSSYFKNQTWSNVTGTVPQPIWSNTSMLSQTNPTATDCGKCHGYPPDTTAGKHPNNLTCSSCHTHVSAVDNITFTDISKHMNGKVEGGGCNGCHWYDTTEAGAWTTSRGTDAALTNTVVAWGAHTKHIDHLKAVNGNITLNASGDSFGAGNFNLVCGVCHDQDKTTNHKPDGGAATRNVDFGSTGSTLHQFGSSGTPTFGTGTRSCSNLDCHFKGTPVW